MKSAFGHVENMLQVTPYCAIPRASLKYQGQLPVSLSYRTTSVFLCPVYPAPRSAANLESGVPCARDAVALALLSLGVTPFSPRSSRLMDFQRKRVFLLARARRVLGQQGIRGLLRTVFHHYVFSVTWFYLYEHRHRATDELQFLPAYGRFESEFLCSNEEADLVARSRDDFRYQFPVARRALDSGAVALCVFAGHELAHVGWIATSSTARGVLDPLGYEVDFPEGVGWTGAAFTMPAYRGKGLLAYSCHLRFQRLLESGVVASRAAVDVRNQASVRATLRFEPRVYGMGRQVRLFCWQCWSEHPVRADA